MVQLRDTMSQHTLTCRVHGDIGTVARKEVDKKHDAHLLTHSCSYQDISIQPPMF